MNSENFKTFAIMLRLCTCLFVTYVDVCVVCCNAWAYFFFVLHFDDYIKMFFRPFVLLCCHWSYCLCFAVCCAVYETRKGRFSSFFIAICKLDETFVRRGEGKKKKLQQSAVTITAKYLIYVNRCLLLQYLNKYIFFMYNREIQLHLHYSQIALNFVSAVFFFRWSFGTEEESSHSGWMCCSFDASFHSFIRAQIDDEWLCCQD